MNRKIGVLISGRGSNLQAIIDAIAEGRLDAQIGVVISNQAGAQGLDRAREAGIEAVSIDHKDYGSRQDFDRAVVAELKQREIGLVCLAGFMRLLSAEFVRAFPNAILNIHPSLLPAFPGLDGQAQAWLYGVKVSGATVHIVTPELDNGPVVLQATVPVEEADTPDALAARILETEHRIYPEAIGIVLNGGWRVEGRRFVRDLKADDDEFQILFSDSLVTADIMANDEVGNVEDWLLKIVSSPVNGDVEIRGNNQLVYIPNDKFSGNDNFIYEICNPDCPDVCAEALVKVKVNSNIQDDRCFVPNIITPNDDGANDYLTVPCLANLYKNNNLKVFNRWGDKVYEAQPYENDWKGTYRNTPLPPGTYFYLLQLDMEDEEYLQGYFTVTR